MNIILLTKRGQSRQLSLTQPGVLFGLLFSTVLLVSACVYGGYALARIQSASAPDAQLAAWQSRLQKQSDEVRKAKAEVQTNIDAFARKMGEMQAHIIRLDALGQQLTKMAGLDQGEFDFKDAPAQGGPEVSADEAPLTVPQFVKALDDLSRQIDDRQQQLSVLENMIMNRNLQKEVLPAGRPIKNGWISSYFGLRTDPFTGRLARHEGMDFAGKEGTPVEAVAAGVVTWAGPRYGYGNLVEINHGDGYATRYGHNEKILVKVGDTVKKGQVISLMGSTGRSTGPHVHFEVLLNGHPVNPARYVQASR